MRKPLKPGYDPEAVQEDLVKRVCEYFGRIYDDFEEERSNHLRGVHRDTERYEEITEGLPMIIDVAREFEISVVKVRRLLITGGCYDTEKYREVKKLKAAGMSEEEIAKKLKKKPATIRSYLPYERVIYKLDERSVNADKLQRFKERWGGYKKTE